MESETERAFRGAAPPAGDPCETDPVLGRLDAGAEVSWPEFLHACSGIIFRIVRTFAEIEERVARVERSLSASQRWRLLARRAWRQPALPIDPAGAKGTVGPAMLDAAGRDPLESKA